MSWCSEFPVWLVLGKISTPLYSVFGIWSYDFRLRFEGADFPVLLWGASGEGRSVSFTCGTGTTIQLLDVLLVDASLVVALVLCAVDTSFLLLNVWCRDRYLRPWFGNVVFIYDGYINRLGNPLPRRWRVFGNGRIVLAMTPLRQLFQYKMSVDDHYILALTPHDTVIYTASDDLLYRCYAVPLRARGVRHWPDFARPRLSVVSILVKAIVFSVR